MSRLDSNSIHLALRLLASWKDNLKFWGGSALVTVLNVRALFNIHPPPTFYLCLSKSTSRKTLVRDICEGIPQPSELWPHEIPVLTMLLLNAWYAITGRWARGLSRGSAFDWTTLWILYACQCPSLQTIADWENDPCAERHGLSLLWRRFSALAKRGGNLNFVSDRAYLHCRISQSLTN